MNTNLIELNRATIENSQAIMKLVNDAYSSKDQDRSWTNESKVVVGERITLDGMNELLNSDDVAVVVAKYGETIIGTVTLLHEIEYSKLNMLAVDPAYQQYGVGKLLISYSEIFLREKYGSKKIKIDVVSTRTELISFYERRGFVNCSTPYPYPADLVIAKPIEKNLAVCVLEKII